MNNAQPPEFPPAAPHAVVLDTNVVLDWMLFGNTAVASIADAVQSGRLRWLASAGLREEFAHVVHRPLVTARGGDPALLLAAWDRWACMTAAPAPRLWGLQCRDASDQPFLDLACHVRARWLLTRDRALLALAGKARRQGLEILVPERWPGLA